MKLEHVKFTSALIACSAMLTQGEARAETVAAISIGAGETRTVAAGEELVCTAQNASITAGDGATLRVEPGARVSFTATATPGWRPAHDSTTVIVDGGAMTVAVPDSKNAYAMFFDDSLGTRDNALVLTNGATFSTTGNQMRPYVSGEGNRIVVAAGSTLSTQGTNHRAMGLKFHQARECELLVTNATLRVHYVSFGNPTPAYDTSTYSGPAYNGLATNNTMRLVDSTVVLSAPGYGLTFGALANANQSFGNVVEVAGSTTVDFGGVYMRGAGDALRIGGGDVSASLYGTTTSGTGNLVELLGGSLANSVTLGGTGNVYRVAGGTATGAATVGGKGNAFEMTGGALSSSLEISPDAEDAAVRISGGSMSGNFTPGPEGTDYDITGGGVPSMLFPATDAGRVFAATDYRLDGAQSLVVRGTNNLYRVSGVSCITGSVVIAGCGNKVVLSGGAKHFGEFRSLVFEDGGVDNALVLDDAEYEHCGLFAKTYAKGDGYPYANLENCAIEFRGAAPKFIVDSSWMSSSASGWGDWYTGTSEAVGGPSTELRFRFVVPAAGWAEAPIQVTSTNSAHLASAQRGPVMQANTVFEVVLSDELASSRHATMRVPLWHSDFAKWNSNVTAAIGEAWCGVDALNATASALGTLPEGVSLGFDETSRTIFATIPGNIATCILFR